MIDLNFKFAETLDFFKNNKPFEPDTAIILGSGLGKFASTVNIIKTFSCTDIPGYPVSTVAGHSGKIHFAEFKKQKLLLFQGRIHFYEGYSIYQCILPVLIASNLKVRNLLLTNAAGGISTFLKPGDLMLIESFNAIQLKKELADLIGVTSLIGKYNFKNNCGALNEDIKTAAINLDLELKQGVYSFTKGPSYETPSEVQMIKKFGGDAVGMSTVHEAVFASYLGIRTGSVSCITNYAAGISGQKLSHSEVTETADKVEKTFENLIKETLKLI